MSPTLSLMCANRAMKSTPSQPVTVAPEPIDTSAVAPMFVCASAVPTPTKPAPRPSALEVTTIPSPGWSCDLFGTVASTITRSAIRDAPSPMVDVFVPFAVVDACAFASAPNPPPLATLFEDAFTDEYEPTRASCSASTDEFALIVAVVPKFTFAFTWFDATPTKPPAPELEDAPVTGALSASSVKLPPAMIQPEWPPDPTDAELLLVVFVLASALPTPTKPPVPFFDTALVPVCEFDLIVTSPPAVTRSASMVAERSASCSSSRRCCRRRRSRHRSRSRTTTTGRRRAAS